MPESNLFEKKYAYLKGGFICTFTLLISLLISLSITVQESVHSHFKIFLDGVIIKTRDLFWSYLF